MLLTKSVTFIALVASAASIACSDTTSHCPLANNPNVPRPPGTIWVAVVDSITSRPIADSASGFVRSSTFSDSLKHLSFLPDSVLFGDGGVGAYAVTVARPGYQSWFQIADVTLGSCGELQITNLSARLQRLP